MPAAPNRPQRWVPSPTVTKPSPETLIPRSGYAGSVRGPMPLVAASQLTKRFGSFTAVDSIDFEVEPGEAFGMLGPNGAGKSSTMRMIGCVSPVTAGSLSVLGRNPATDGAEIRGRLGSVPQEDNLDLELTVWDNMIVYGRYFGIARSVL